MCHNAYEYDENIAQAVFQVLAEFAIQAQFLIEQLDVALGKL